MIDLFGSVVDINVAKIIPSRWQPRQLFDSEKLYALACSIRDQDLINPVLVFKHNGNYELIAGERRTRAVTALNLSYTFPEHKLADWCVRLAEVGLLGIGVEERAALTAEPGAVIKATLHRAEDLTALHLLAVTENLDRDDLSPVEEAAAYKGLLDAYGWNQRELAARVNRSQGYIAQRLSLLNLGESTLNALNTQVINLTHARAIAAVPAKLQEAATSWSIQAISKDDSPATTRQVENQMRAIAAFMDPDRWRPNDEHIYTPQQRNRLGVIRMLISGPHAAERIAEQLPRLVEFKNSYTTRNLFTTQPLTIVEDTSLYTALTNALGMRPQDAWQNYSQAERRLCQSCEFYGTDPGVYAPGLNCHCPRWGGNFTGDTCENHLGPFDPIIIYVNDYNVRMELSESDPAFLVEQPFPHATDIAAYVAAYRAAAEKSLARKQAAADAKTVGPRRAIQEFWEWQKSLPAEDLHLSNAHRCPECRYFEPLNGDAPCRFALNPLAEKWGDGLRAPQHSVLVGLSGIMLPRCEMYTWRAGVPFPYEIYQMPGFSVGTGSKQGIPVRNVFMQWMSAPGPYNNLGRGLGVWRGPLAWLGACDGIGYKWDEVYVYLLHNWDKFGDGGMATLLTALIHEKAAFTYGYYDKPITLLDLRDGREDRWMVISFEERRTEQRNWPDVWWKPWL